MVLADQETVRQFQTNRALSLSSPAKTTREAWVVIFDVGPVRIAGLVSKSLSRRNQHAAPKSIGLRLSVKPDRLDWTPELLERIDSFLSSRTGIANEIVETFLAANDHKMRYAVGISQPSDYGIPIE
jgi:hypothetical protein